MMKEYTVLDLIEFYKIHNRLPNQCIREEKGLYQWMSREKKKGNREVIKFLESIGYKFKYSYTFSDLINFYKIHDRLPNTIIKKEWGLYMWMNRERKRGNKEVLNFLSLINNRDIPEIKELLDLICSGDHR